MALTDMDSDESRRQGAMEANLVTLFKTVERLEAKIDKLQINVDDLVRYRATVAGIAFAVSTAVVCLWQTVLTWWKRGA